MKFTSTTPSPIMKPTLFLSIPVFSSLVLVAAPLASAAVIYPSSATTDGGTSSSLFDVSNLFDESVTGPGDTLPGTVSNNNIAYVSADPPTGGFPVTITVDFTEAVDLSAFYLWNISHNTSDNPRDRGVRDFSLTFYDGAGATGSQIGTVYSATAAIGPLSGVAIPSQTFTFASAYEGVLSVEFKMINNQADPTRWVGAREIAFAPVPEPSSSLLGGLCGVALLLRRRRSV
ncbi:PEP-CTERM sorting domain-containing protein [Haloferula sp. A504]|uniref:PEP-CTERM sorting domain-containing protein n=1 Tax=Haloferula sp. A504 TaxID=3373601 RepID=UPI0031CAC526|nr:PEP-CTERM sorting domain-containing protein [Verrucomicrobiaceae bacterium E54]